jgi:hypothetical protein
MNFKKALDRLMIFGFSIGTLGLLLIIIGFAASVGMALMIGLGLLAPAISIMALAWILEGLFK